MLQKLLEVFTSAVLPVLITWLAAALVRGLSAWRVAQQAKSAQSKTAALWAQLAILAELVVSDIEANERAAIKDVTADGHISKEDAERLKGIAVERLKTLAKEHGFEQAQAFLVSASPAIGALLSGLVEKAVDNQKAPTPPTAVLNLFGKSTVAALVPAQVTPSP